MERNEMPRDHIVDSVTEAVALAETWRIKGSHTWFRGHPNESWALTSTLSRLGDDPTGFEAAQARIGHFCSWLRDVPELQYLLEETYVHECFAVLQHYGVPTHYIDFTTVPEVAGFFAANTLTTSPPRGCIIAIDPDDFVARVASVAEVQQWERDAWPEKIVVAVPSLWRMQAQSGVFIYLPKRNVETFYGYDRILFPHDRRPYVIAKEKVFPTHKSALEMLLDEFFTEELMHNNQRFFSELFAKWKAEGGAVAWAVAEEPDHRRYLKPGASAHPSWERLDPSWSTLAGEPLAEALATGLEVTVPIPSGADGPAIESAIATAARQLLAQGGSVRTKTVTWRVDGSGEAKHACQAHLERVWDGMRRLPYADQHLVTALAATASRSLAQTDDGSTIVDRTTLELANSRGATARARVRSDRVRAAYRADIETILTDPSLANTPRLLLQALRSPKYVFDFDRLVDLFATDIIPAQVSSSRDDLAVFFAPTVPLIGVA